MEQALSEILGLTIDYIRKAKGSVDGRHEKSK